MNILKLINEEFMSARDLNSLQVSTLLKLATDTLDTFDMSPTLQQTLKELEYLDLYDSVTDQITPHGMKIANILRHSTTKGLSDQPKIKPSN